MSKEEYIKSIVELMQNTNDMVLIDFIHNLLNKAG